MVGGRGKERDAAAQSMSPAVSLAVTLLECVKQHAHVDAGAVRTVERRLKTLEVLACHGQCTPPPSLESGVVPASEHP